MVCCDRIILLSTIYQCRSVSNLFDVCSDCILWIWWCNCMQFCVLLQKSWQPIVFCKQSCIQYAVKFLNAVPITCNHLKIIGIIDPGLPLASPLPCPSSHCCATCLKIYLCGWVRSVELVMIRMIKYSYLFTHAMH